VRSPAAAAGAAAAARALPQDPAVISQTGLCVWRSGPRPELDFKTQGSFLQGLMALLWTGNTHTTYEVCVGSAIPLNNLSPCISQFVIDRWLLG
jgi:hypothetical protein